VAIVGTWNVENLFRPGGAAGPTSQAAYARKLSALARVIDRLAPDVLALQEIGDPLALQDLVARLDGDWHTAVSTLADRRGIRVGFLSRHPLRDVEHARRFPEQLNAVQVDDDGATRAEMSRGLLRVRVDLERSPVDLVTCHLKSKLLSYPGERFFPRDEGERARFGAYALNLRAAEAVTVRAYASRLLAGEGNERAVVVLGDLNDEPAAATTQVLHGPPGSEIGTRGENQADQGDPWRLWNLAPRITAERRYSRIHNGRPELIDHILVSRALLKRTPDVHAGFDDLPSVTGDPRTRRDEAASDHAPVTAGINPAP
jgi:predicted extracellular nuclease